MKETKNFIILVLAAWVIYTTVQMMYHKDNNKEFKQKIDSLKLQNDSLSRSLEASLSQRDSLYSRIDSISSARRVIVERLNVVYLPSKFDNLTNEQLQQAMLDTFKIRVK
jgi:hypothetical protein